MNVYRFIGDRIRKCRIDGKGRHISSLSSKIGTVSVAVSIAVIIVAVSVVMGFRREISDKTSGFMGQLSLVAPGQTPMNEQYPFTDSISYLGQIEELASVSGLSRVAYRSGLFKTDDNIFGVCLKGVDSLYNMSFFEDALQKGSLPNLKGRVSSDILISGRLAAQMRCDVGDDITAYFVGEDVKVRKFKVCGLFDAQLEDLDNTMVVCDLRQVQRLNGWSGDEVSTIEIRLKGGGSIDRAYDEVDTIVYEATSEDDPPLFVTSVKHIFAHLFDWLRLLDFNVVAILLLMIVVAGFNMISSLLIILFENISTIGLLKAMGMTTKGVGRVFRRVALGIVAKGLLIGNGLALSLCFLQKHFRIISLNPENYFVKFVPIEFNFGYIILANALSLAMIMAILMLTSLFVARVSPAKTMRVA